jgi:alpha-1,3-rhamnosyltransferase
MWSAAAIKLPGRLNIMPIAAHHTNPLISILIAAYNEEKYVAASVASCLDQTYGNIEIVITDDGSEDRTTQVLEGLRKRDARVKFFSFPENRGKVAAFNNCFSKSTGAYIAILGADDLAPPDRITRSLPPLLDNAAELVCGDCVKFSADRTLTNSAMYDDHGIDRNRFFDFDSLLKRPKVFGGTIMLTRILGDKIFPLDEDLKHEDWWLPLAAAARRPVRYLHHPFCYYRIHADNEKETNPAHTHFDVWRIKSQERKVIHYQKVISQFTLTPDQATSVKQKKLIHELILETNVSRRLWRGCSAIRLLFNRSLGKRDKLKFIAAWLVPRLAFQISKQLFNRRIKRASRQLRSLEL